jgi:hypothetical protein
MPLAAVLSTSTTPAGHDGMGRILGGSIELSAHLRPKLQQRTRQENTSRRSRNSREHYDDEFDDSPFLDLDEYLLLMSYQRGAFQYSYTEESGLIPITLIDLILGKVPGNADAFQRLGSVEHAWGKDGDDSDITMYPGVTIQALGRRCGLK